MSALFTTSTLPRRISHHSLIMLPAALSFRLLVLVIVTLLTHSPPPAAAVGHKLDTECTEHGAFACHNSEAGSFTRCIEYQLYLFHCPLGLHFNTHSQTCDWPENADCGDYQEYYEEDEQEEKKWGRGRSSSSNDGNSIVISTSSRHKDLALSKIRRVKKRDRITSAASKEGVKRTRGIGVFKTHGGVSAPIRLSGTGRPWWRPENVDPKAWEDLSNLVEVPFDGTVSASASDRRKPSGGKRKNGKVKNTPGAEGGKHKSEGGSHSYGHFHRPVVKVGERAEENPPRLRDVQRQEGSCSSDTCRLPQCRCPGTDIPGGLSPKSTPQMVMVTFDDEVSAAFYGYFQRLFRPGRYNPNGCPVRGCLFVSGSGTDYDLVYPLYAMGMELASHTLSHKFPHTWWASASYRDYVDEVEGMRRALSSNAGVPHDAIKGFRVPFLQLGGDNMYKTLYDNQFLYDTSMFTGSVWEGSDPVWPFTLDYVIPEEFCQHGPCPQNTYPGLWEIPVQRWYGIDGLSCAMPDGCTASADAEEDLEFFRSNFKRHYQSNRAPFGIFVHARWFHTEHHLDALDRFIDELMQLEDVYVVTPTQVIEWMRKPTPLGSIQHFKPWDCEGSASAENQWKR